MFVQQDFDLICLRWQDIRQLCCPFDRRDMDWHGLIEMSKGAGLVVKGRTRGRRPQILFWCTLVTFIALRLWTSG